MKLLDSLFCWSYFIFVVLLRLLRIISQDRFCEMLFGDSSPATKERVLKKK